MNARFALLPIVSLVALAAAAAEPPMPHPVLVRVDGMPAALASADAWRAWPLGSPADVQPLAVNPTSSAAWRELIVLDALGQSRPWVLVAEKGDTFAVLEPGSRMAGAPAAVTVPVVESTPVPGGVRLSWDPLDVPGVAGWDLLRSSDGRSFELVTRLAPDAAMANDAAPAGAWTHRLRPVFTDGVESTSAGAPSRPEWSSASGDRDGDGVADVYDRCAEVADPSQADTDADGVSDACEFTRGDVAPAGRPDGRVDVGDVVTLLRWAVGLGSPSAREFLAADLAPAVLTPGLPDSATPRGDAPAVVAIDDAVLALRASVGLVRLAPPR